MWPHGVVASQGRERERERERLAQLKGKHIGGSQSKE